LLLRPERLSAAALGASPDRACASTPVDLAHSAERKRPDRLLINVVRAAVPREQFGYGVVWTRVALDADMRLVPSYWNGPRNVGNASAFMADLPAGCDTASS
jgi:hypothetical protein